MIRTPDVSRKIYFYDLASNPPKILYPNPAAGLLSARIKEHSLSVAAPYSVLFGGALGNYTLKILTLSHKVSLSLFSIQNILIIERTTS